MVLGPLAIANDPPQITLDLHRQLLVRLFGLTKAFGAVEARLDSLREVDLLFGVEEGDLADLLEVGAHRIG